MKKVKILSHKNNYILCDDDLNKGDILTSPNLKLKVLEKESPVYKIEILVNLEKLRKFTNMVFKIK